MQIKEGQKYEVRVEGKLATASVTRVEPKGRGHTVFYQLQGKDEWNCSLSDFLKAAVKLL